MKGLTFDNFINHSTNQNAYDVCVRLSRFEGERKSPVVLLGERGAGKSHLLWALVNYYRSKQVNVGIALISATDFPAKVKDLAVVPAKLATSTPVVLLVDDLQKFSQSDAGDLEKVLFAVHEHGHTVVVATQIHPNVLPVLSGKFKAFLNSGVIIGMKPLPKSNDSSIPEAALQQIAALKSRIAELETTTAKEPDTRIEVQSGLSNYSEAASLIAPPEIEAWQQGLADVLNRFEEQKAAYETRFGELSQAADRMVSLAAALRAEEGDGSPEETQEALSVLGELDEARRIIALKDKEITQLRLASGKLAEALERQELEVNTVISSIRETVASLSRNELEAAGDAGENELSADSRKTLNAIAEQLQALEGRMPEPPETELPPLMDALDDDSEGDGHMESDVEFPTPLDLEGEKEARL